MDAIAKSCAQLQSIDFDLFDCPHFDHHFQQIATNCPQIKKFSSKKINDASLDYIIRSPNLESLDVRDNYNISGLSFKNFGENIEEISLNSDDTINNTVISQLLLGNGKRIKKLSIYLVSDNILPQICTHFTQLTHLDVHYSYFDANFDKLSLLTNLTGLSLTASDFPNNQLQTIIKSLNGKNIREFEVTYKVMLKYHFLYSDCTDNDVSLICAHFPNLSKLSLNNFINITDSAMSSIARLHALSSLSLEHCSRIGDEGVLQVIGSCPLLRHLSLHYCQHVSDAVLHAFIALCEANAYDHSFVLDVRHTSIDCNEHNPRDMPRNLLMFADCVVPDDHYSLDSFFDSVDGNQRRFVT